MKPSLDCIPCLASHGLSALRLATDDEQVHRRVLPQVMAALSRIDMTAPPPVMAQQIHWQTAWPVCVCVCVCGGGVISESIYSIKALEADDKDGFLVRVSTNLKMCSMAMDVCAVLTFCCVFFPLSDTSMMH